VLPSIATVAADHSTAYFVGLLADCTADTAPDIFFVALIFVVSSCGFLALGFAFLAVRNRWCVGKLAVGVLAFGGSG